MNQAVLVVGGLLIVLCILFGRQWLYYHRRFKKERFRYFEDSPDFLCTAGFDGIFLTVNSSFLRTLGYTQGEMVAHPFLSFVHEADKETTIEASLQLSQGKNVTEFENRYLCKNGSWKWLMWNSTVDKLGGMIFASAKDITRRKELEESLKVSQAALIKSLEVEKRTLLSLQEKADALFKSNQELASFAHVVAHDLQEPLRTITSYCVILEENNKSILNAEAIEVLSFITDASRRMKDLIGDLLIYGRVDHRDLKLASVSLTDVMDDVLAMLKVAVAESNANFSYESLPNVYADHRYMVQLFQNLIGNAIKFRGDKSPIICISATREGDKFKIGVQDNGIGIAPRHHQRIFGMFKRLHTRERYEGTGIGLALCKKIVDILNGTIWVESEVGEGATFYVSLLPVPQQQPTLTT